MEDCIIIGGGPAGLTAAIYLARYRLDIRLFDAGQSRARWIPTSHNHAGFPEGIHGEDLLARMLEQAEKYGARREETRVTGLARDGEGFVVTAGDETHRARCVLIATGVVNNRPEGMDDALHDEALARGLLRYCPVCDGYEVTDKRVAVIGTDHHGCAEAEFLRAYTADLTLISPDAAHTLDDACKDRLQDAGIAKVSGPASNFAIEGDCLALDTGEGRMRFDSVYPALGSQIRSELAKQVGAKMSEEGCIAVDDHLETSVPGLFAAGDVIIGLDQISRAMGDAAIATTEIRHRVAEQRPVRR